MNLMTQTSGHYYALGSFGHTISIIKNVDVGQVQVPLTEQNLEWFEPEFGFGPKAKDVCQPCFKAISSRQYRLATDIMLNETLEYSQVFAATFEHSIMDRTEIPFLFQDLWEHGTIQEEDYNRLSTLLMVLEGLDLEVNEWGGEITNDDVDYAREYIRILERVLSEHHYKIGVLGYSDVIFYSDNSGTTKWDINQGSLCVKTEEYLDHVCERNAIVSDAFIDSQQLE
jgi:hypothetical protein